MRRRALTLALAGAYLALALAWAMSNAPFTAPDEKSHYLRAVGIAGGELVGRRAAYDDPTQAPETRAWVKQLARSVEVPRGLSPVGWDCPVLRDVSAACQPDGPTGAGGREVTAIGTYQPVPYLLPAAVVRAADDPGSADRLGRLVLALAFGALIGAAALALASPLSLLGLVVAVTPLAVFVGASLNGSGLEIAAAIAFAAALLRVTRAPDAPRWVWWLAGIAGVLLALSRTVGPLWVLAAIAAAVALSGWRSRAEGPDDGGADGLRRPAIALATALLAAVVANRVWESAHGPDAEFGLTPLRSSLGTGWRQLDGVLLQSVGEFGHLQVELPAFAYVLWGLMAAGLAGLAFAVGRRRDRIVLGAALAGAGAFPVLFYAAVARHAGIPLQGRHVLPLFAIVALLAAEILHRNRDRLADRNVLPFFLIPAAAIQVVAWLVNAERWAVDPGTTFSVGEPQWAPPLGWTPWFLLVLAAAAVLTAAPWLTRASWRRR